MSNVLWEDLKGYVRQGENFVEGLPEHFAVLLARHMDAERRKQLETDIAAIDAPVEAVVESTPVDVAAIGQTAEVAAMTTASGGGVDANGSPVA